MKTILVVDDMAVFREPIAASLRLAGYQTLTAADGEDALQVTRATPPDLILLDISMPKMDGITFLRHLRADPRFITTRVILLTAINDKKHVLAAAAFGVRDYLLKSRFRLKDLLDRIERPEAIALRAAGTQAANLAAPAEKTAGPTAAGSAASGPVEIKPLMTRDEVIEKLEDTFQAKTLSGIVAQVIALASSPKGNMADLATLIGRDPMLSTRILQTANSTLYATGGAAITTIPDAIRKVGFTTVRGIASALGVFDCIPEAAPDGFNPIRCWQHSFAVAQLCERLASSRMPEQSGLAYLAGLCHDLGEIFVRTKFNKEYQQVIEIAAQTGTPKNVVHAKMLGVTTTEMVGTVLKCMGLPEAIREPIEAFHAQPGAQLTEPLAKVLYLAENFANAAMLASSPSSQVSPITQTFCRGAVGDANPSPPDPQALRTTVLSLTVSLARLSRDDESKLIVPLFKPQKCKVWVARARGVSAFDPIGLTLQSLAGVELQTRLPTAPETSDYDALVLIVPSTRADGFSPSDIDKLAEKVLRAGKELPTFTIACEDSLEGQPEESKKVGDAIALSDLARFVEQAATAKIARAAA